MSEQPSLSPILQSTSGEAPSTAYASSAGPAAEVAKPRPKIRKNQKDDFDYSSHIAKELNKLKMAGALAPGDEKNAVIRIRNRVSAQRSRMRQRNRCGTSATENEELKARFEALKTENSALKSALLNPTDSLDPVLAELQRENAQLKELLAQRVAVERELAGKLAEIHRSQAKSTQTPSVIRDSLSSTPSPAFTKSLLLFSGLLIISALFAGKSQQHSQVRTMGFDFLCPSFLGAEPMVPLFARDQSPLFIKLNRGTCGAGVLASIKLSALLTA